LACRLKNSEQPCLVRQHSSASIPILLDEWVSRESDDGRQPAAGFGAGLTTGVSILEWGR
jgi:3-oxoacyl-[acyl-carrier-protein] synthase III